jgi:hypothetical protein
MRRCGLVGDARGCDRRHQNRDGSFREGAKDAASGDRVWTRIDHSDRICGMKAMPFKTFVRQTANTISGVGKKRSN